MSPDAPLDEPVATSTSPEGPDVDEPEEETRDPEVAADALATCTLPELMRALPPLSNSSFPPVTPVPP
jgi:hypothetical protein